MQQSNFTRRYIMLRPACGHASGFARLESQHGRGRVTISATQLAGCETRLRALLLSGDEASGSVLDLGPVTVTPRRQVTLKRDNMPLPAIGTPGGYHTLVLATDWPDATLLLYGWLVDPPVCTLWQLQEAVRHYLAVPTKDSPAAPVAPPEPPSRPAPAPAPAPRQPVREEPVHEVCHVTVPDAPAADTGIWRLSPLIWPEPIAELKIYFDTLPPTAPFDLPGWRFVQVPLPSQQPAPYCDVGIRARGGRIVEVAYALPGVPGKLPPGGLRGYHWQEGRNGQGYWVLRKLA